jgi:hypothetical protein
VPLLSTVLPQVPYIPLVAVQIAVASMLVALVGWTVVSMIIDILKTAQRMHQIPCASCKFFTNDYHLKCTVHPSQALSEDAIRCPDYCPNQVFTQNAYQNSYR